MPYLILIILIMTSIADYKKQEVPILCMLLLFSLIPFTYDSSHWEGLFIVFPFFVSSAFSKGMGGGDWKIIMLLELCLGVRKTFFSTVFGCIIFIAVGFIVQRVRREDKLALPFIPCLTAGYVICLILEAIFWIR